MSKNGYQERIISKIFKTITEKHSLYQSQPTTIASDRSIRT